MYLCFTKKEQVRVEKINIKFSVVEPLKYPHNDNNSQMNIISTDIQYLSFMTWTKWDEGRDETASALISKLCWDPIAMATPRCK